MLVFDKHVMEYILVEDPVFVHLSKLLTVFLLISETYPVRVSISFGIQNDTIFYLPCFVSVYFIILSWILKY